MMTAKQFFREMERENACFDDVLMSRMSFIDRKQAFREKGKDYEEARESLEASFIKDYNKKEENLERVREGCEIWRGARADNEYIESLIEGKASTGVCWTYKEFSSTPKKSHYARHISIKLTAIVISEESINVRHSQLLNLNFAEENEVRLKYNEKILLKSIEITSNYNSNDEDVKYPKGTVIKINKIVSTGDVKALGDGWSFMSRKEVQEFNEEDH